MRRFVLAVVLQTSVLFAQPLLSSSHNLAPNVGEVTFTPINQDTIVNGTSINIEKQKLTSGGVCCSDLPKQEGQSVVISKYISPSSLKITGILFSSVTGVMKQALNYVTFMHSLDGGITMRTRKDGKVDTFRETVNGRVAGSEIRFFHSIQRATQNIGLRITASRSGSLIIFDDTSGIWVEYHIYLRNNNAEAYSRKWTDYSRNRNFTKMDIYTKNLRYLCVRINGIRGMNNGEYCLPYLLKRGNIIE